MRGRRSAAFAIVVCLLGTTPHTAAGPAATRTTFGRSVRGEGLAVVRMGSEEARRRLLVVACIHGNECAGKAIVAELRRMTPPEGVAVWIVWDLNPDGSDAGTRQNARGVDLNRNFARGWRPIGNAWDTYHSGPGPFSEPETRAARRLVLDVRPHVTIWYHQAMRLVARQDDHVGTQRAYARRVGLPLVRLERLPGTASRWQNHRFPGHTSFVVELAAGRLSRTAARTHARAALAAARGF